MKAPSSGKGMIKLNKSRIGLHRRSLIWLALVVMVLLSSRFLPESFFEIWYYDRLFRWIRTGYDFLLGWSPVPMIYIVVAIVLARSVFWLRESKKGFAYQFSRLAGGVAFIILLFYLLWGFNYHQRSLQDKLGLRLEEVTAADMDAEFYRASKALQDEARNLPVDWMSDQAIQSVRVSDRDLRKEVERSLADLRLLSSGNVRVRELWPKGFLLRWSTAGIYIPHAFEGHIDPGLLSVQKPFSIAHEMAHGYGITDEGACNFIAWLACRQSDNKWVRFGGALTYWRYAAAEMPDASVEATLDTMEPIITRSLFLIRENDKKYPDLMPRVRDAIYSSYLKRHGVKGGLRSYNYVVLMVRQYLESKEKG